MGWASKDLAPRTRYRLHALHESNDAFYIIRSGHPYSRPPVLRIEIDFTPSGGSKSANLESDVSFRNPGC